MEYASSELMQKACIVEAMKILVIGLVLAAAVIAGPVQNNNGILRASAELVDNGSKLLVLVETREICEAVTVTVQLDSGEYIFAAVARPHTQRDASKIEISIPAGRRPKLVLTGIARNVNGVHLDLP